MSYAVNLEYTGTGRVEVKIQVIADNHEKAFKAAQNVLNLQKTWYKKHKEEARADQKHYKKLLQYGPAYDDKDNNKDNNLSNSDQVKQQQLQDSAAAAAKDKELINTFLGNMGVF